MSNMFILVGRLMEVKENGVMVNIPRSYKNEEGTYDSDKLFIKCFDTAMKNIKEFCRIGDVIGAKGRVESSDENIELVCEKFSFISSNKDILEKEKANEE